MINGMIMLITSKLMKDEIKMKRFRVNATLQAHDLINQSPQPTIRPITPKIKDRLAANSNQPTKGRRSRDLKYLQVSEELPEL